MDAIGKGVGDVSKSGYAGQRLVRIVVATGLVVVAAAILGAGFVYLKFGALRSSEPYRMALERVQKDPAVVQQIGEPVGTVNWFPGGVLEEEQGSARLHFSVAGPKGRAQVSVQARRISGTWYLQTLDAIFPDGTRRSLSTEDSNSDGAGEAPKWSPGQ